MKFTKVTVRKKKIAKGRISLYLDFYPPIIQPDTGSSTRREFLGLHYVERPRSEDDTAEKVNALALAEAIRVKREVQIRDGQTGGMSIKGKTSFISYFEAYVAKHSGSTAKGYRQTLKHLSDFTGKDIACDSITPEFIDNFKHYLLTSARIKTDGRVGGLSANTASAYFIKFMAVARKAYTLGYITNALPKVERIKKKTSIRAYLTLEELQTLAQTDCEQTHLKRAALFSALTGLRFSDIAKMTWKEVQSGPDGYFIEFKTQKTGDMESLPISNKTFSLLGERGAPDAQVFPTLKYSFWLNTKLRDWVASAGIKKKINFHCFRHTYATLQLNNGTDIYTVSKLLGHKDIATTQIYAKLLDTKKRESVDRIDIDL